MIAYVDLDGLPLVRAARDAVGAPGDAAAVARLAAELFPLRTGLAGAMADAVLGSTGPFAQLARRGIAGTDPRLGAAARDLDALGVLAAADAAALLAPHGLADAAPPADGAGPVERPPEHQELRAALLAATPAWGRLAAPLAEFHRRAGCGPLAEHRVLRSDEAGLRGVAAPDPITLDDLEGGERLREDLLADLSAFVAGGPANDALLYGPPGTGKSATVKALAARFAGQGLRLVQVERGEVATLPSLFRALAGAGPRCLVALDDLVFDDAGRADRALRSALEGDVEARPDNVLVWATSNRMKLIEETHREREEQVERDLARGEKAALATRFGRRVRFDPPGQEAYVRIAERLVRDRLGHVPPGTASAALRFARAGHGATPRTARQFAATVRLEAAPATGGPDGKRA